MCLKRIFLKKIEFPCEKFMRCRSFCLFDKGSKVSILELLKYTVLQILTVLPKSDLNIKSGVLHKKRIRKTLSVYYN